MPIAFTPYLLDSTRLMAGLLSRFKSVFSSSDKNKGAREIADGIIVEQPSTFSILTAQYGFYTTILGDIDDHKPFTVPQKLVQSVVEKTLSDKEPRVKAVPRLPSVIPKLLQSLRDPDSSGIDYIKIINKDPAMSTTVLKMANSVYFNPTDKRVTSIEMAVVKLGVEGLRSAMSAAVLQPVIRCRSHHYTDFGHKIWFHSLCCAVACEAIAKRRGLEPYKAYLLGLVHDIGKITIFSSLSNQFTQNVEADEPGYAAFAPLMQSFSEELSHTVARDWQLPDEICSALEQQIDLAPCTKVGPYAHLLYQANLACEIYAIASEDNSQMDAAKQALEDMSLPPELFSTLDLLKTERV
jgi:HD-like signal output (HDOD) protein